MHRKRIDSPIFDQVKRKCFLNENVLFFWKRFSVFLTQSIVNSFPCFLLTLERIILKIFWLSKIDPKPMITFKKLFLCKCYHLAIQKNKRQAKRHRVPIIVFETIHLTSLFETFWPKYPPNLNLLFIKFQKLFSEKPKSLSWPFLRPLWRHQV